MNRQDNFILFDATQKFVINRGKESNLNYALSANRNLMSYGYSLSEEAIMTLGSLTVPEIVSAYNDLIHCIELKDGISDFRDAQLFYPNFPEEVLDKSEEELYLNASIYYLFGQSNDPRAAQIAMQIRNAVTEELKYRLPDLEGTPDLKVIGLAKEAELDELLKNRIYGMSISSEKYNQLKDFAKRHPDWKVRLLDPGVRISSHENMAKVAMIMYEQKDIRGLRELITKADDALRFAAALSHETLEKHNMPGKDIDANLSIPASRAVFKLSKPEKRLIKDLLNNCDDLFYAVWAREDYWKKLMNRLDTRNAPPAVKKAFDHLASKKKETEAGLKIVPAEKKFEDAFRKFADASTVFSRFEDAENELEHLANAYPALYARHFENYIRKVQSEDLEETDYKIGRLCAILSSQCTSIPVTQTLQIYEHISKSDDWAYLAYVNKNQGKFLKENNREPLHDYFKPEVLESLKKLSEKQVRGTKEMGNVWIDPELSNHAVPMRAERNASAGATLTKHSTIPCEEDKNLLAFAIFWKNQGDERADIDLSVASFDKNFNRTGEIAYYNLREYWGVHSGDFVSGQVAEDINGAEEMIVCDKSRLREDGCKYLVVNVHGFNKPFNEAESVRFMMQEKAGSFNEQLKCTEKEKINFSFSREEEDVSAPVFLGEKVDPAQIKNSLRLNQPRNQSAPLVYDVENDRCIWLDSSINLRGICNIHNRKTVNDATIELYMADHNSTPNMYDLFHAYAEKNGKIVEDIQEADTVFLAQKAINDEEIHQLIKEDADVITAYDLDRISAEFCDKQEKLADLERKPKRYHAIEQIVRKDLDYDDMER